MKTDERVKNIMNSWYGISDQYYGRRLRHNTFVNDEQNDEMMLIVKKIGWLRNLIDKNLPIEESLLDEIGQMMFLFQLKMEE